MSNPVPGHRPNLFVIGAPKCGTTSLHYYLRQHPNIFMSPIKEPRFWSEDLRAEGKLFHSSHYRRHVSSLNGLLSLPPCLWRNRDVHPQRHLGISSLEGYLALFNEANPSVHCYLGEASTDSMWSRVAAERIAGFSPDARIVIMLRDPVDYIRSVHRESLKGRLGENVTSLDRALSLEAQRRKGRSVPCTVRYPFSVLYRQQAHFDEQIQRYLDRFLRERIHFVLLDDLSESAEAVMRQVCDFLELPFSAEEFDFQPQNAEPGAALATLSESWRKRLIGEFRPVVRVLQEQTGLPLAAKWNYD